MPFELCPKCSTMMNEIKRQLIVPERLVSGSRLPASFIYSGPNGVSKLAFTHMSFLLRAIGPVTLTLEKNRPPAKEELVVR